MGWLNRGLDKPETIAQHMFRVALLNWLVAQQGSNKLNICKIIKASLAHDLCEVYAGDTTPYDGLLSGDPVKDRQLLSRWIRLSKSEKEQRAQSKFGEEDKALRKLVSYLPKNVASDLLAAWLEYEQVTSQEGRFVRQGDKVETLLQAVQYFGPKPGSMAMSWWEEVEDIVDGPELRAFVKEIEDWFYRGKKVNAMLGFILEAGKLKALPRRGWLMRRVKDPETIADHTFLVALMVWVLGKSNPAIDLERALKMALIHEICAVYAGDHTPHDIFARGLQRWFKAWGETPRLMREERQKLFLKIYDQETKALNKLINRLPAKLKGEILELWTGFVEKRCPEANFVDQVNALATYLQALEYWRQDNSFPINIFAEHAAHFVHDKKLVGLLAEMNESLGRQPVMAAA